MAYTSALLLVTVHVRFFVCVCVFVLFIKLFIRSCVYLVFECFLALLSAFLLLLLFFISSFSVLVFICFFVRFSFSLSLSLPPCVVVFLHIRSSNPLNCVAHKTLARVFQPLNRAFWSTSMAMPWRIHCLLSRYSLFRQYLLGHRSVSRPYC